MRRSRLFFITRRYSPPPPFHPYFVAVSKGGLACSLPRETAFQMTSQNASLRGGEKVSLRSDGEDDDDGEPM